MTAAQLREKVKSHASLAVLTGAIDPNEIHEAASLAQEEILRELELLEEVLNLSFIANQEVYSVADPGWGFLSRMVRVKHAYMTDGSGATLLPKSKEWVDSERFKIAKGQSMPSPRFVYTLDTDPYTVGFWGIPSNAATLYMSIVRGHEFDVDDISDSVDPKVPNRNQELLIIGTLAKLLEYRCTFQSDNAALVRASADAKNLFEMKKKSVNLTGHRSDPSTQYNKSKLRM